MLHSFSHNERKKEEERRITAEPWKGFGSRLKAVQINDPIECASGT